MMVIIIVSLSSKSLYWAYATITVLEVTCTQKKQTKKYIYIHQPLVSQIKIADI